jgi:3-hydroxyacyl-[acyl-carrier-protein] dehydratase
MRFNLVDRIAEVEPGRRIRGVKQLTLGEEYLADHFPTFPVMPGVLMLQALVELGTWLLRVSDDFRYSVVVLREAKGVKYGTFLAPGHALILTAEVVEQGEATAVLKGSGQVDGNTTVSGRFSLARYNLRDRNPALHEADERLIAHWRSLYAVLRGELAPRQEAGAVAAAR